MRAEQEEEFQKKIDDLTEQLRKRELQMTVEKRKIEQALGINFGGWNGTPIETVGAAMRLVLSGRDNLLTMLTESQANIERIGQQIQEAQKGLTEWPTVDQSHHDRE